MQKGKGSLDNLGGCFQTLAFSVIFLLVGAGLSWWGWTILQNARASTNWPAIDGQITSSLVEHSTDADGADSYSPKVTYSYFLDNQPYEGHSIKFGENSYSNQRKAREILNRYPVGRAVIVFYDPANPENSVLEPGVSVGSYVVLGIGVLFVLLALIPPLIMLFRALIVQNK